MFFFLPAYSPFLNPIENCFAKWKHLVKKENVEHVDQLLNSIQSSSEKITQDDCQGYYMNMLKYLRLSQKMEPIYD